MKTYEVTITHFETGKLQCTYQIEAKSEEQAEEFGWDRFVNAFTVSAEEK